MTSRRTLEIMACLAVSGLIVAAISCHPITTGPDEKVREIELLKIERANLQTLVTQLQDKCDVAIEQQKVVAADATQGLDNCVGRLASSVGAECKQQVEAVQAELQSCYKQRDKEVKHKQAELKDLKPKKAEPAEVEK